MDTKALTVILTASTGTTWGIFALVAKQAAAFPLLGLLPLIAWPYALEAIWPLIPIGLIYLIPPALAWKKESKLWAWVIPVSPILGSLSFTAQFMLGMSAFN